jgi:ribonuclease BN (tRNA processing enzyme)
VRESAVGIASVSLRRIAAGIIYQDANIKVTAVENTHFRFQPGTPPYGKYKSFSYRFDTLGRSFLFTGDTGWSDAVIDLAKGADVLVTEVTDTDDVIGLMKRNGAWQAKSESEQKGWLRHMHEEHVTPEEVGRLAAQAGVKTVVMTHLSRHLIRTTTSRDMLSLQRSISPARF